MSSDIAPAHAVKILVDTKCKTHNSKAANAKADARKAKLKKNKKKKIKSKKEIQKTITFIMFSLLNIQTSTKAHYHTDKTQNPQAGNLYSQSPAYIKDHCHMEYHSKLLLLLYLSPCALLFSKQ
jgi:hypothetical protein